ncbi:MAG: TlpA family protein disulfide reductase [Bacteroidota bacterium]|nr:TlpA family protein disulfide reductase [Bacteroidota bacterium]
MKKFQSVFSILAIAATALLLNSCSEDAKKGNVSIYGSLSNSKSDTLFLFDVNKRNPTIVDSVVTGEDGSFAFNPTLQSKGFYSINVGRGQDKFAVLILEPGDSVKFTGDANNLGYTWKTEGSKECDRFQELNVMIMSIESNRKPLKDYQDSLMRVFQVEVSMVAQNDSVKLKALDKKYSGLYDSSAAQLNTMEEEGVKFMRSFIDKDPASFANIAGLRLLEPFDNFDYYEKTVIALEAKYKDVSNVKMLRGYIETERPYCKGQFPPDIIMNDPDGKTLKLSSMKGKVVLIDFWASWCGPCRTELPNVVANYKKYKDKGFDIFSVSLDQDKNAWVGAIKSDGLTWPNHVSDLLQWQTPLKELYRIKGIPKTVLLGKDGKIIDRDLGGPALTKKLAEIFAAGEETNGAIK